ncbi:hypothetical protein E0W72_08630, partial [Flavobacterium arcticum]
MIKKVQRKIKNLLLVAFMLSAAISFGQPIATSATDVTTGEFTATWQSVTGATGYYLDVSESSTFGTNVVASNLIISEYGEGSGGSKKYIEIFNGTGATVDLSNYELWIISNGGSWPESDITLSGTLANDATYVIANNSTDVYNADMYTGSLSHNGDDALGIAWNGGSGTDFNLIDAIGDGIDPGSAWSVAGVSGATKDKILIRKSSVFDPTTDWGTAAGTNATDSEWIVSSFTYNSVTQPLTSLGSHTFDGGYDPSFLTGYDGLDVGNVTSYNVTGLQPNTTYYFRVRSYDGVTVSGNSNVIQVTTTVCGSVALPTAESQSLCSGIATVANLTVTTGEMPKWYEAETGGTALAPEATVTTGTYYVSQTVDGCESARVAVAVSVNTIAEAPEAEAQVLCGAATIADLTSSILVPPAPEQEDFSSLPSGTLSANYDLSLGSWELNSVLATAGQYLVLFNSNPGGAHITSPSFDGLQSITFDAVSLGGVSTISVIKIVGGIESLVTTINPQQGVNVGDEASYNTYTVDINDSSSNIQIKLESSNVTGEASFTEAVQNISFTGYSSNIYNWYDVATGGTPLATDAALVTGTYYVSQIVSGCESVRTAVAVTINEAPAAPTAASTQTFCGAATVADLMAEGISVFETTFEDNFDNLSNWNVISINGDTVWETNTSGNPSNSAAINGYLEDNEDWLVSNPITIPSSVIGATFSFDSAYNYSGPDIEVYYTTNYTGNVTTTSWQLLSPVLSSSGGYSWVNSGDLDVSEAVGSDLVIAFKYTSENGTNTAKSWNVDNVQVITEYENINWYDADDNMLANVDALATATYYVSQTVNGCESTRTEVTVTVNPIPDAPTADAQAFCGSATVANLAVTTGDNPMWYDVETGG